MSDRFNSPIMPSVGRVVLVRGSGVIAGEPLRDVPGLVVRVWGENTIDVHVFNGSPGGIFSSSVQFNAEDDDVSVPFFAWRWMPYQVAKAAETTPNPNEVREPVAVTEGPVEATVVNKPMLAEEHVAEGLADHPDDVIQPIVQPATEQVEVPLPDPAPVEPVLTDAEALANRVTDPVAVDPTAPGAGGEVDSGSTPGLVTAELSTSAQPDLGRHTFGFGTAIELLEDGKAVTRSGWNGKDMFIYLVPAASYPAQTGVAKNHFGEDALVPYRAYLAMKTVQGDVVPWLASQSDVLEQDWVLV